ncbi:MAG: glucosamine-6-phosphate deaminase [Lachnospiraceae bacterium]|nr:glucosamine-6-phosphate deaminase [Lachnospiraceae bacterium]
MRIIRAKDYADMSRKAANIIRAQVTMKPDSVLGLATGGSPEGIYKELVAAYNNGDVDFSEITSINLDEYKGMPRENEQSYWYFMHDHFFNHVNVRPQKINVPDGTNLNSEEECARYDQLIEAKGGIDLQLLGIGFDGHIGFNEPADTFTLGTHCVDLEESTIEANKRYFEKKEDVPRQAYTMGIKAIMQAKKVVMVVSGSGKADIVRQAFFGPVTPQVPASILQMHPDFTLIGDEEAFSKI